MMLAKEWFWLQSVRSMKVLLSVISSVPEESVR